MARRQARSLEDEELGRFGLRQGAGCEGDGLPTLKTFHVLKKEKIRNKRKK
jgi:hypothetical protein